MDWSFLTPEIFTYVILPVMIFCARICDVTMGTIRVIFISKGIRYLAPVIGFFEVIIWLLAIGQVMNNLTNAVSYVAYGAGFAAGTFIGMYIEEKISIGLSSVRIITKEDPSELMQYLRSHKYGVTSIDGEGATGRVKMIFTIIQRQDLPHVVRIIKEYHPNAFYSVEEVKSVAEGVFPDRPARGVFSWIDSLRFYRKGK
ncbi:MULTISPECIES: DUF2179 domain-containing protein [unclassified Methanoregula]|uniref:DUF2179 domain-containing protein n=1 Tax=unclassified Methanoregula TaxID=2649730 RepID=UPI0009C65851|nr:MULTISPECIES: DUF2179 domain-containing protein [unclassified Methanoregula]OPX64913.1 MAG: hypothetical protein A4E33_00651 [Methanoregula sp. PtaB.Bin085]OPY32965.1 MAG: hypothetical protein A4E34_02342 [Methanoregula sp. PtaU1.Bin006]